MDTAADTVGQFSLSTALQLPSAPSKELLFEPQRGGAR
jgi:hypothetical protein